MVRFAQDRMPRQMPELTVELAKKLIKAYGPGSWYISKNYPVAVRLSDARVEIVEGEEVILAIGADRLKRILNAVKRAEREGHGVNLPGRSSALDMHLNEFMSLEYQEVEWQNVPPSAVRDALYSWMEANQ